MSMPTDGGRLLRYVDALREGIAQEMERDPRVFLFGLDVDDHKVRRWGSWTSSDLRESSALQCPRMR
jgi:hypothetical protein